MNNRLRFNTEKGNVFFVSDLHFGHDRDFVLNPRGYKNVEEAKSDTIRAWNDIVTENDVVFNIGDIVLGAGQESRKTAEFLIRNLRCKKHYFVWGNHNAGVNSIYNSLLPVGLENCELYPLEFENKFVFLGHYSEIIVNGQLIILTHYPIGSWNEMKKGHDGDSWNIHGHTHANYEFGKPSNKNFKQLDVSWETFKRPASFNEINRIMKLKGGTSVDHHGK